MAKQFIKSAILILFLLISSKATAAVIKGNVIDNNNEPIIGATVIIPNSSYATATDINGNFEFLGVKNGSCDIRVSYFSFTTQDVNINVNGVANVAITLTPQSTELGEVTVTAQVRRNTELALLSAQKNSLVVQTGVSEQQIKRSQDKDASEVIRRVPGISIIDERFVMVRGLSQRYNNVWVNNSAVPSSESDSRAFSFEIIPSSQLDNMIIVKSSAPEYPADFSGGFIMINTKDIPTKNSFNIGIGGNVNDKTHFSDFLYNKGSKTDFLGFDNGLRGMKGGIHSTLNSIASNGVDLLNNGFNNNWVVSNKKPIMDLSINADLARRWVDEDGRTLAMLAAVNYSNSYRTYTDMENSLFGAYDVTHNKSNYLRHSVDDQYTNNVRLGAMLNLTFVPSNGESRYEFKNIFNQLGKDRYTFRNGINAQSDLEQSAEYYYSSRTTYNGQFTGRHTFNENNLDWSAGYAYANCYVPDRRRYLINDALEEGRLGLSNGNDMTREYTKLDEHIASATANYKRDLSIASIDFTLKAGAYGEYRTRTYDTRSFIYNWNASNNTLPDGFRYSDLPTQLFQDANYGADKLYLLEMRKWSNNYSGNNMLGAGYIGVNIPIKKFNIYAGIRYEYSNMELISNSKDYEKSPKSMFYKNSDIFPSFNTSYKLNDAHQFRLSYGKTVNRPEFREVSPSVFYDFDLASNVQGNYDLKSAYINNVDIRYEYYPTNGEIVSVSLFYKHFTNPIEWTYTVNGGTDLTYSFVNAKAADNYGIEVDIRKDLAFLGMPNFSINFNGALIKSKVQFDRGAKEKDRPMQGQSPYLINTGLFYQNNQYEFNAAVLYNRIGKRIIGVGRSLGTSGDNAVNIPDSYEMPRNSIDLSFSKQLGKHFNLKLAVRNLLSEKISYMQFDEVVILGKSENVKIEQTTREYNPGRNYSINISYNF